MPVIRGMNNAWTINNKKRPLKRKSDWAKSRKKVEEKPNWERKKKTKFKKKKKSTKQIMDRRRKLKLKRERRLIIVKLHLFEIIDMLKRLNRSDINLMIDKCKNERRSKYWLLSGISDEEFLKIYREYETHESNNPMVKKLREIRSIQKSIITKSRSK
jgi:hypothetical protein